MRLVVAITAEDQIWSREETFKLGVEDVISKPIKSEDLIPRVRRFIS